MQHSSMHWVVSNRSSRTTRRERYRQWAGQRSHDAHSEAVAVVLLVAPDATADDVMPTVRSIAAQTRAPAELVVVSLGPAPALASLRARADLFPFDLRWVDAADKGKAAALDAGIAASSARWLVVVEPPHAFASRHLEALFGGIESAGAQWGFTDCELVAGSGSSAAQLAAARVSLDATHTTLAKADSVGSRVHRPDVRRRGQRRHRVLACASHGDRRIPSVRVPRALGLRASRDAAGRAGSRHRGDLPPRDRSARATADAGGSRGDAARDVP